jgi:hypothetical protein
MKGGTYQISIKQEVAVIRREFFSLLLHAQKKNQIVN